MLYFMDSSSLDLNVIVSIHFRAPDLAFGRSMRISVNENVGCIRSSGKDIPGFINLNQARMPAIKANSCTERVEFFTPNYFANFSNTNFFLLEHSFASSRYPGSSRDEKEWHTNLFLSQILDYKKGLERLSEYQSFRNAM